MGNPPTPLPTESRLRQAWNHRLNREFHECREVVHSLQRELGVRVLNGGQDFAGDSINSPQSIETVLLLISLMRADGKPNLCRRWLECLEAHCREQGISLPFQFYFQKGIGAFAEGDYPSALDAFLAARPLAASESERLSCLGNLVFCLEALGLSFEKTLEDFYTEVSGLPAAPPYLGDLLSQVRALEMRQDFRRGAVDQALAHGPVPTASQAAYLGLWIRELPFHRYHKQMAPVELEALLMGSGALYSRPVRLRTLQGIAHETDLGEARPSEVADRLYLWVWRWLANPSELSPDALMAALPLLKKTSVLARMTCEDLQMVRNSLLWLCLFSGFPEDRWKKIRSQFSRNTTDYPLFEFEDRGLEYLRSRLDPGGDWEPAWKALIGHPLWKNEQLSLSQIFRSFGGDESQSAFSALPIALNQLMPAEPEGEKFLVDLVHKVLTPPEGDPIYSEPLCLAIDLLWQKRSISAGQFVFHVFGLTRFEPEIHNPKIFNILARLKALSFGEVQFKVKSEVVHAEGNWPGIRIHRPHPMTEQLLQCAPWLEFWAGREETPQRSKGNSLRQVVALAETHAPLSREVVQTSLEVSRATATRLLKQCVEKGYLEKIGAAKNTRYTLGPQETTP